MTLTLAIAGFRRKAILMLACHLTIPQLLVHAIEFSNNDEGVVSELMKCPGRYCGRTLDETGNFSSCGACPRGYRVDKSSFCRKCTDSPLFYEWLYLGFMAILAPALHAFFIDFTNKRKNGALLALHVSALLESSVAVIATLLVMEPMGSLNIYSCGVEQLSDWYTMLYNPSPGYTATLHCTQEAVYPLYTIVMIYYAFCLVLMMLVRPMLSGKAVQGRGSKSIYAALYFFPILVVVQAVFAGLLYYSFAYITVVVSLLTSAIHFSTFSQQNLKYLLKENFTDPRNILIMICHWFLHAFGIVAITQLREPSFHASLILLVPVPACFYILTVKFTDPYKLEIA